MQDIITLKEQGVSDSNVIDLLHLKGRQKEEVEKHLVEYYQQLHATKYVEKTQKNNTLILLLLTIFLLITALVLGWFIFVG